MNIFVKAIAGVILIIAVQEDATAAGRRGKTTPSAVAEPSHRPLMTTPGTIIPTGEDIRNVPPAGGGRLIGYTLNLHPGGRAARMLLSR